MNNHMCCEDTFNVHVYSRTHVINVLIYLIFNRYIQLPSCDITSEPSHLPIGRVDVGDGASYDVTTSIKVVRHSMGSVCV